MADSTLTAIRTKVRRLTRSPSVQQLSDATIDEYANTFILYDFPEHLRLFSLRQSFTFYTVANVDTYATTTTLPADPLYQFKDRYITVHDPVYIAGYKSFYSQSRAQFFGIWPFVNMITQIGTGTGALQTFSGTLADIPILRGNVVFSTIDTAGNGIAIADDPQTNITGNLVMKTGAGVGNVVGTINYVTGVFTFTSVEIPGNGEVVNIETVPYQPSRPTSLLYYNNVFTVRPVPDQSYPINIEVYARPIPFNTDINAGPINLLPQLQQWWQYIAYGTAKKIFEDRSDTDSLQIIYPEYKAQEMLVLRTTLVQQGDERAATIYSQQTDLSAGPWGWNNGWQ